MFTFHIFIGLIAFGINLAYYLNNSIGKTLSGTCEVIFLCKKEGWDTIQIAISAVIVIMLMVCFFKL